MILAINGHEYKNLHITKYLPKYELLDGEGTGRTKAALWDMVRDPQGFIVNFELAFAPTDTRNSDYIHLCDMLESLGTNEFVSVYHLDPRGKGYTQDMYFTMRVPEMKRVHEIPETWAHTRDFSANFIARRGRMR